MCIIKNHSDIVTVEDLAVAISNSIDLYSIDMTDAENMAEHVLNLFGYEDMIVDNLLTSRDRDLFYMLEDSDLLSTERHEVLIAKGKVWRIHYWVLRKERIRNLKNGKLKTPSREDPPTVYDTIPNEIWVRV